MDRMETLTQDIYTFKLRPHGCFTLVLDIDSGETLRIVNAGETLLIAYRGVDETSLALAQPAQILIGDTLTTKLHELPGTGPVLIIRNTSDTMKGKVEVSTG